MTGVFSVAYRFIVTWTSFNAFTEEIAMVNTFNWLNRASVLALKTLQSNNRDRKSICSREVGALFPLHGG